MSHICYIFLLSVVSPLSSSIKLIIFSARQTISNVRSSSRHVPVANCYNSAAPVIHKIVYCIRIFTVVTAFGTLWIKRRGTPFWKRVTWQGLSMVFHTLQAHHDRFGFALKSSVMVSKLTWPLNQSNGRVKLVATLSLALSRAWALLWILFGSDWLLGSGLNTLNQTAIYVD